MFVVQSIRFISEVDDIISYARRTIICKVWTINYLIERINFTNSFFPMIQLYSLSHGRWRFSVEETLFVQVIICISSRLRILKLRHFEQFRLVLWLHFKKVLAVRVIMCHCTRTSMTACISTNCGRSLGANHFILLHYFRWRLLSIVIAYNVAHRSTWSIGLTIRMRFLWYVDRLIRHC